MRKGGSTSGKGWRHEVLAGCTVPGRHWSMVTLSEDHLKKTPLPWPSWHGTRTWCVKTEPLFRLNTVSANSSFSSEQYWDWSGGSWPLFTLDDKIIGMVQRGYNFTSTRAAFRSKRVVKVAWWLWGYHLGSVHTLKATMWEGCCKLNNITAALIELIELVAWYTATAN